MLLVVVVMSSRGRIVASVCDLNWVRVLRLLRICLCALIDFLLHLAEVIKFVLELIGYFRDDRRLVS